MRKGDAFMRRRYVASPRGYIAAAGEIPAARVNASSLAA